MKIVIPYARTINALAAAGALPRLFADPNSEIVVIQSVMTEIIASAPEFAEFMSEYRDRIQVVTTSVCDDDGRKTLRGEEIGTGRSALAVADFMLNFDDVIGDASALVVVEGERFWSARRGDFPENTSFISTADYLLQLDR